MDRETRDDLVVVIGYAVAVFVFMFVFGSGRLDDIAARLHRPGRGDDTMEARAMVQVQREISMMEHGYGE